MTYCINYLKYETVPDKWLIVIVGCKKTNGNDKMVNIITADNLKRDNWHKLCIKFAKYNEYMVETQRFCVQLIVTNANFTKHTAIKLYEKV